MPKHMLEIGDLVKVRNKKIYGLVYDFEQMSVKFIYKIKWIYGDPACNNFSSLFIGTKFSHILKVNK